MELDFSNIPVELLIIFGLYYAMLALFLKERHNGNKDLCVLLKISLGIIFAGTPFVFSALDNVTVCIIEAGLMMSAICDVVLGLEKFTEKYIYSAVGLISATMSQIIFFAAALSFRLEPLVLIVGLTISLLIFYPVKRLFKEHVLVYIYQSIFFTAVIYSGFICFFCGVSGIFLLMIGQLLYLISDIIILGMRYRVYYFGLDAISKVFYYTAEIVIAMSIIYW